MLVFDQLKRNDPPLRLLALVVFGGLFILTAGLWWVQIVKAGDYQEHLETQSFRTVRVPALRGRILDRNRNVLAENRATYNVNLYLEDLTGAFQKEYERRRPVQTLTNSTRFWKQWLGFRSGSTRYVRLKDTEVEALKWQARYQVANSLFQQITARLQQPCPLDLTHFQLHYQKRLVLPYRVLTGLSPAQVARFEEQCAGLPGVDLEVQPVRDYPGNTTAAHLLGHLQFDDSSVEGEDAYFSYRMPDYRGAVGVEGGFDRELRGRAGAKSVLVNSLGYRQTENLWPPTEPGRDVVLTLDLRLQQAAELAMQNRLPAPRCAAVVILDVNNGDILALASSPTFNPNDYARGFAPAEWERLNDEKLHPQLNRATQGSYPPGSIFKTVVGLAALEAGLNPNEIYQVAPDPLRPEHGIIQVKGQTFHDLAPPGPYDFGRAFFRSSNAYFIYRGIHSAGIENIVRLGQRLHFGEVAGLPTRQDVSGVFPTLQRVRTGWSDPNTGNVCIGQDPVKVTPLQMAVATAAIANGGMVFWPRLVARIESPDPLSEAETEVLPAARVRDQLGVSARNLKILRDAMLADTEDPVGTAYAAFRGFGAGQPPGGALRVCGKTGTAQIENKRGTLVDHVTWFISFAPYEAPRYAVVVMVEGGGSGGTTCAPVARDIYEKIQQYEIVNAPKTLVKAH